jgi:hypothetical protein
MGFFEWRGERAERDGRDLIRAAHGGRRIQGRSHSPAMMPPPGIVAKTGRLDII